MWWEPRSDAEAALQRSVQAMRDRYRRQLSFGGPSSTARSLAVAGPGPGGTSIRGIGAGSRWPATPVPPDRLLGRGGVAIAEEWQPLVVVDAGALGTAAPAGRVPWTDVADSPAAADLQALEPTPDTLVEAVGPIATAVTPGDPATSAAAGVATVGLPVTITVPTPTGANQGFLTVAHGTPSPGGTVATVSAAGLPVTGTVVFHDDSARANPGGGDDIALVALPAGALTGWVQNAGAQAPPTGPPYQTLPVDLYASQSGHVLAQVNGALLQFGDQNWQWQDCWELGGTTPGMRPGDSGSLAVGPTAPHPLFGHFVGGAVNLRGAGFTHHWVQDLGRVLARQPGLDAMIRF